MSSPPQEPQSLQPTAATDQEERSDLVEDDTPLDDDTENEIEDESEREEPAPADPAPASRSPEQPSPPVPKPVQVPDRYEMGKCTIHISITLLEGSNQPQERSVLLGVRNDADVPIISMVRLADLEPLPAPIAALLAELETSLPQRKQAMAEQLEKTQREQAAKAAKPPAKPRTPTAPSPPAQAATPATSSQPTEKTEEIKPPTPERPQQKQTSASKRHVKEEDSPFEQMTFF